ncbi:hypothetical protein ACTXT7_001189 [Hymenolepis weldensis]
MANDFATPRFNRLNIPEAFLFPDAQLRAYKITSKHAQFARLLNGLMSEVAKLVYKVLGKLSTTPYNDLKFAILERMEEPKLEFSKRLQVHENLNPEIKRPNRHQLLSTAYCLQILIFHLLTPHLLCPPIIYALPMLLLSSSLKTLYNLPLFKSSPHSVFGNTIAASIHFCHWKKKSLREISEQVFTKNDTIAKLIEFPDVKQVFAVNEERQTTCKMRLAPSILMSFFDLLVFRYFKIDPYTNSTSDYSYSPVLAILR